MSMIVVTCFTIALLLGNICPTKLLAYATTTRTETSSSMTHAKGIQFACKQKNPPRPITSILPESNTCSSGHCLAKDDPSLWLQVSLPSAPRALFPVASFPFLFFTASSPDFLALFPQSSTGPPVDHIKTIVLRM